MHKTRSVHQIWTQNATKQNNQMQCTRLVMLCLACFCRLLFNIFCLWAPFFTRFTKTGMDFFRFRAHSNPLYMDTSCDLGANDQTEDKE
jgi:hypothetical protein